MIAAHRVDAAVSHSLPENLNRFSAPERHVDSPHILGETQVVRPRLSIHRRAVRSCAGDLLNRFGSGGVLDIKRALQNARVVCIRVHVIPKSRASRGISSACSSFKIFGVRKKSTMERASPNSLNSPNASA